MDALDVKEAATLAEMARDEYRETRAVAKAALEQIAQGIPVFIVRRNGEILSAWTDEYAAKFEASRWEQDSKIPHDYVPGLLLVQSKS